MTSYLASAILSLAIGAAQGQAAQGPQAFQAPPPVAWVYTPAALAYIDQRCRWVGPNGVTYFRGIHADVLDLVLIRQQAGLVGFTP